MTVLERSELEASPLADLHTIANQIGIDGFRRLRKAELIDAILRGKPEEGRHDSEQEDEQEAAGGRRRRFGRSWRRLGADEEDEDREPEDGTAEQEPQAEQEPREQAARPAPRTSAQRRRTPAAEKAPAEDPKADEEQGSEEPKATRSPGRSAATTRTRTRASADSEEPSERRPASRTSARSRAAAAESSPTAGSSPSAGSAPLADEAPSKRTSAGRRGRAGATGSPPSAEEQGENLKEETVEGVVELQPNGSAFLRVDSSGESDRDVYVSAAQVRRCELVAGDRVAGPVRMPRRSERYPSLVRVETVNGASATQVAEGPRYEELKAVHPTERLALESDDATLRAIEWLTPIGRGSRAMIVGAARAGKTETLRRLVVALADREGLELTLVLVGIRPEEAGEWEAGPVAPATILSLATSQEAQGQAVERAIETGKRVAARGGNALVAIDSLDHLQPGVARRALAAARKLEDGGSLTVIATGSQELGGETTVIALDVALTSSGRLPALDLARSGTIKPELLVGEDGAKAITEARAAALEG